MFKKILLALAAGPFAFLLQSKDDKPKKESAKQINERPTSTEGYPVPVVFGTPNIKEPNVVWYGDLAGDTVHKDDIEVNVKYWVGMQMVLCHAPVDGLLKINVGDVQLYSAFFNENPDSNDQIVFTESEEDLFGGEYKGGGISGTLSIMYGTPEQDPNEYISGMQTYVPAYRGILSVVLEHMYIGTDKNLKSWDFTVQRIHKRYDGIRQWYDEKSAIALEKILISPVGECDYQIGAFEFGDPPDSGYTTDNGAFGDLGVSGFVPPYAINVNWPSTAAGSVIWIKTTFVWDGQSDVQITGMYPQEGGRGIWVNDVEISFGAGETDASGIFKYFRIIISVGYLTPGENVFHFRTWEKSDLPGSIGETYAYFKAEAAPYQLMNPIHIIRECLTDPRFGLGYLETDIDDDSFRDAADVVYAEEMGMSMIWDRKGSVDEFIDEVKRHINCELYVDRTTGKWVVKLVRDDYSLPGLTILNQHNITKITDYKKFSFNELTNTIVLSYTNMFNDLKNTITFQDQALVQQQGGIVSIDVNYEGFSTTKSVNLAGARDLKTQSLPSVSCTIYADKSAEVLNIGDVFRCTFPDYDIDDMVFRVASSELGDGNKRGVKIKAIQDIFDQPLIDDILLGDSYDWLPVVKKPGSVTVKTIQETPYYELSKRLNQTVVDTLLNSNELLGYVMAAAVKTSIAWLRAEFYRDRGSGYVNVTDLNFSPAADLDEDISHTAVIFDITDADDLSAMEYGDLLQIGEEMMSFVFYTAPELSVGRGALDTVPTLHSTGDKIIFWGRNYQMDSTEYNENDDINVKLPTVATGGKQDINDATEFIVTMNTRAIRPYPPGQFAINGEYFPAEVDVSGAVVLTWVHRDRRDISIVQTFTTGSLPTEPGVEYVLAVRDASDESVIYSQTGLTTEGHTIPAGTITVPNAIFELSSVRDGHTSYTLYWHTVTCTGGYFGTLITELYEDAEFVVGNGTDVFVSCASNVSQLDVATLTESETYFDSGSNFHDTRVDSNYVYALANNTTPTWRKIHQLNVADLSFVKTIGTGYGGVFVALGIDSTYMYIINQFSTTTVLHRVVIATGSFASNDTLESSMGSVTSAVADASNLYLSNTGNDRILIRSKADGSAVSSFGSTGTGDDNFDTPQDMHIIDGDLWILDSGNDRIKIHTTSGVFVDEIPVSSDVTGFFYDTDNNVLFTTYNTGADGFVKREYLVV